MQEKNNLKLMRLIVMLIHSRRIQILLLITFLISFLSPLSFAKTYPMPSEGDDIIGKNIKIIVQEGDTLEKLAKRYGVSWHEIVEANQDINADRLEPEQELVIPLMRIL